VTSLKDSYNTRIATNGAKALDLAKASPQPDLILLDVMLPDLDGYEVCSQGYVSFRNLPTLIATAID
jgi:CheY-like chemotaxis protein